LSKFNNLVAESSRTYKMTFHMEFDTRSQTPDYQYVKELILLVFGITGKWLKSINPALTTF